MTEKVPGALQGVTQEVAQWIERLQPFKTVDIEASPLYLLRELSNRDKLQVVHLVSLSLAEGDVEFVLDFSQDIDVVWDWYQDTSGPVRHGSVIAAFELSPFDGEMQVQPRWRLAVELGLRSGPRLDPLLRTLCWQVGQYLSALEPCMLGNPPHAINPPVRIST